MPRRSANLEIMVRAAAKAARMLVRDFGEVEHLQVSIKGPGDFVSAADRRAEKIIIDELRRMRPEFGFLSEETGAVKPPDGVSRWIIDPLDGTTNYLHGLGHWAISIALEQRGELNAAVIFDPLRDEMFTADKGDGAYLNDRRIRTSSRKDLDQSLIACGLPIRNWKGREAGFVDQMNAVADVCGGLRRLGACALDLAYVAAGRQDGFWEYGIRPWDFAAGAMILREAGGRIGRLEGDEDLMAEGTIVAAAGGIYPKLRAILEEATPLQPAVSA